MTTSVQCQFFVGLSDLTWFRTSEYGSGIGTEAACANAVARVNRRFMELDVVFVHVAALTIVADKRGVLVS